MFKIERSKSSWAAVKSMPAGVIVRVHRGRRAQRFLKTENGVRDVDFHPSISAILKRFLGPYFGTVVSLEEWISAATVAGKICQRPWL
jgi:hypothetical protein